MALSERELRLIEEGIRLAVAAVLAAVRKASETGDDAPLDWSKLRITETPEMALERARSQQSRSRNEKQDEPQGLKPV